MSKNIPNLVKDVHLQIQEAEWTLGRIKPKKWCNIQLHNKTWKSKGKVLIVVRGKWYITGVPSVPILSIHGPAFWGWPRLTAEADDPPSDLSSGGQYWAHIKHHMPMSFTSLYLPTWPPFWYFEGERDDTHATFTGVYCNNCCILCAWFMN